MNGEEHAWVLTITGILSIVVLALGTIALGDGGFTSTGRLTILVLALSLIAGILGVKWKLPPRGA